MKILEVATREHDAECRRVQKEIAIAVRVGTNANENQWKQFMSDDKKAGVLDFNEGIPEELSSFIIE